jgi:hypothetical protein
MDRFETVRAVETIRSPLLLIHGQEDADVLISNSHTLFHTALTARRLQSFTKELAVTEAGEAREQEDELARAGLELTFQSGHSSSIEERAGQGVLSRRSGLLGRGSLDTMGLLKETKPTSFDRDSGIGSGTTSGGSSTVANSPRYNSKEPVSHGNGPCQTVQLDFPREGSLEYNQEYQIGFLTVQYAVHNTCTDFVITKEVLGAFLTTVENRRIWSVRSAEPKDATIDSNISADRTSCKNGDGDIESSHEQDLAKVLCLDKIGLVDLSEVPEVVE